MCLQLLVPHMSIWTAVLTNKSGIDQPINVYKPMMTQALEVFFIVYILILLNKIKAFHRFTKSVYPGFTGPTAIPLTTHEKI